MLGAWCLSTWQCAYSNILLVSAVLLEQTPCAIHQFVSSILKNLLVIISFYVPWGNVSRPCWSLLSLFKVGIFLAYTVTVVLFIFWIKFVFLKKTFFLCHIVILIKDSNEKSFLPDHSAPANLLLRNKKIVHCQQYLYCWKQHLKSQRKKANQVVESTKHRSMFLTLTTFIPVLQSTGLQWDITCCTFLKWGAPP